jgi:hypothetical protein
MKKDEIGVPVDCPDCSGSGKHPETQEECKGCGGWGSTMDWKIAEPPLAHPVSPTAYDSPLVSIPDFNNVEQLRELFGDKVPQDFDPKNARHFGQFLARLDPEQREFVADYLFSHDQKNAGKGVPPTTGSSLKRSEQAIHWYFDQLGEEVLQRAADMLSYEYVKAKLMHKAEGRLEEEREAREERRRRHTNNFEGKPKREEDDAWSVVPKNYKPIAMKNEKKPYMGRDEGIRRSKLPPGAPGADKAGVGIHNDKKKEADKKKARKFKIGRSY